MNAAGGGTTTLEPISQDLLAILVCPDSSCRGKLEQRGPELVCLQCGLGYRIEKSWPVLIPEEARRPDTTAG